jgi:uncharacterized ferritin-like protein (DUF455 family)
MTELQVTKKSPAPRDLLGLKDSGEMSIFERTFNRCMGMCPTANGFYMSSLHQVWRFENMPMNFYTDWMKVAFEESQHFELLHSLLQSLGYQYGDFDAHDGLWQMCAKTATDVLARMALVPRTLEARGLDATPLIQVKLRKANSPGALRAVEVLDVILRDEVGHVAIGNHWYRWLCEQRGLDPVALYSELVQRYDAPRLKPPFNNEARKRAGFTDTELSYLLG